MKKDTLIKIKPAEAGQRLDLFLTSKLKITRSQAQKLIDDGRVMINGVLPKKMGQPLRKDDAITVISTGRHSGEKSSVRKNELDSSSTAKAVSLGMTVSEPVIVAATPDYIVVEKPTGMLTHPTMANEKNTLVNFLVKKYPEIKKVSDSAASHPPARRGRAPLKGGFATTYRPGIVHRLDKEASGLLVVARTQKMFDHLKEQFKNRTIEKEYWALAHGKVAKDWDEITFPIARAERSDRMAARPLRSTVIPTGRNSGEESLSQSPTDRDPSLDARDDNEKEARTEFFVEKRFVNFTLLKVVLHTGRMHQIRVHLLAYNHPLVGDPLYNQPKRKSKWDALCRRLFLHSAKLGFTDLKGERQTFESPLPPELQNFLKLLK